MCVPFEHVSFLCPTDGDLSSQNRFRIQVLRLLTVFAAVALPFFGIVPHVAGRSSAVVDPLWLRGGLAGLLLGLFGLSYVSKHVRRRYPVWGRRMLYLVLVWFAGVAMANDFTGSYDVRLLVLYALLLAGVGMGAQSMRPVLLFAGVGIVLTSGSVLWAAAPGTDSVILILSVGTLAVVGCIVIQGGLSIQKRLLAQERLLRTLNENVSDGIYRSVPGDGIVYANRAFAEMFGYGSVEEVREIDPAALYAEPAERERLQAQAREQGTVEATEVEFRRKDGSTFTGLLNGTVVWDADGEVKCYDGTLTDVTKQKQRERQLSRRNRQLQQIRENVTEVIWMSPADKSCIEFISTAYEDVWGRPTEEVKAHPGSVVEAIHPDDRERVRNALAVQKEHPETYEETYRVVRPDGTVRWVRDRAAGVYDEEGELERIVGVATDVTERRRLQERLLEVQAEERRRITEEIHSEMGGRLSAMQFAVQAARSGTTDEEVADPLDRIEDLVRALSTSLRTISRRLYPSDLADYGLVEALSSLIDELERQRGLAVGFQNDLARGDRFSSLLERTAYWIVQETLLNVIRHAETDAARVEVTAKDQWLFLRVADDGVGFDPSQESEFGTFGLEGIRRRVERLKGEIEIDTEPGRGTEVSVRLPIGSFSTTSPDTAETDRMLTGEGRR